MQNQAVLCPQCRSIVEMRHDGSSQDANDYTSPWVFVDHPADEQSGPALCFASGRNVSAVHRHD